MRKIVIISAFLCLTLVLNSCKDDKRPNYQYMPNMYESVAYETYSESKAFNSPYGLHGKEGQLPPVGAIKRGFQPYDVPNTTEGYQWAKANLNSPLDHSKIDLKKAQELFEIYCSICHGTAGDGKGTLVKNEKFLGVPAYADRQITEGSIFHVITYGLNSMGSHANQLSQEERWLVAAYVLKLKSGM